MIFCQVGHGMNRAEPWTKCAETDADFSWQRQKDRMTVTISMAVIAYGVVKRAFIIPTKADTFKEVTNISHHHVL